MGGLGAVLGDIDAILGGLGAVFGRPWGVLGCSWGVLGRLGAVLGCPGRLLGGSWGALGRSKIDQKIDPKLDAKTGRIATEKNGPNTTPVVVSALDQTQRNADEITQKTIKTAIDMISSYLSINLI